jgi:hypothetical protein
MAWSRSPQDSFTVWPQTDGTVVTWGLKGTGEYTVPEGLNGPVAIAANGYSLALKSDGTVVAWGNNYVGESTVPDGLKGVVAIAAGPYHSLALIAAAAQPFSLGAPQWIPDGSFRWTLLGEAGRNYTVQSSTNLTLWTDLQTVVPGGSSVSMTDTNASAFPRHFYRVRTQ